MMNNDELKAIIEAEVERAGGELKPEALVKRARAKAHPLHAEIWGISDKDAALSWRVDIARKLISSVRIEAPVKNVTPARNVRVAAFLPSTRGPVNSGGFVPFAAVVESRVESYGTLEVELRALRGHYMRCMNIAAGLGLTDEAEAAMAGWDSLMGTFAAKGVVVPVDKRDSERESARM